jgi:fructokinase
VLARERVPTCAERGYEAIIATVAELAARVCASRGLSLASVPIGVGMPGGVSRRSGLVKNSNTVCLNGRPFRADLERALGRPVAFDNDANCFALAEATLGAARGHDDGVVMGVIMGTGVGGGLVLRGRVWSGLDGIAGEWGHHAVFHGQGPLCYCGRRGCLETFASGPAIERAYLEASGTRLSVAEVAARRASDPHAARAIEGLLEAFGRGLANVLDVLDPSIVVLGGGLSNLSLLYDEGRERVARYVFDDELRTPIVRHALGDSAGVLGAALLALEAPPLATIEPRARGSEESERSFAEPSSREPRG